MTERRTERHTFPFNEAGLVTCLELTLAFRREGFKTRVATRQMTRMTTVYTLLATHPVRATRSERGCLLEEGR